jgi:Flp pilus assembly protein TadD
MADIQDDIIIIEESDAAVFDDKEQANNNLNEDAEAKKKKIIIFGGAALALILVIIIVLLLIFKSSEKTETFSTESIEERLEENTQAVLEPSKLENMISKANYLYTNGSKDKALHLYEQIALYSEAISHYNLGVAQLKNEQYEMAMKTFQKAIQNDEKRCVSAINAAVCALHLEDKESFKYYIDLAHAYLANEINSPLYSYYYTLINYYNKNYLEALSSLTNTTSNEYPNTQKHLKAKINALFASNYDAIESLEDNFIAQDSFSIALLYARVGDYTLAIKYLEESILNNIQPTKARLALGLINLKAGRVAKGAKEIKNVTDMFPEEVYTHYPIKVSLKESLYNETKAQEVYRDKVENSKLLTYQKIFYFSPYKVFNANQTISYIRKGTANIFIDNVDSAKEYLQRSASSSSVNLGIAKAIKKALSFKTRQANQELQRLVKIQPKHSTLHYNLALTYAQMGDMNKAYKHFIRSYHLDAKNYLSGIYAIMTSQLIQKENSKLTSIIKDAVAQEDESEKKELYQTLLSISANNIISAVDWLDNDYEQRPLYLAMDIIIALKLNRKDIAQKSAQKLTILLPSDIVPHMMYIDAYFGDLETKMYATEVHKYLQKQSFNFKDLYYGPYITRYLYIQQNFITGRLYFLKKQLRDVLESTNKETHELTSALALTALYNTSYEESYTLYNHLIDELKVRDAYTLFLGAVASTAAGHHGNAIALLELAKMKDTNMLESRYALGLLYLEIENNEGAVIQLTKVGDEGFSSDFFNFEIDTDKLLFKKQHPKE